MVERDEKITNRKMESVMEKRDLTAVVTWVGKKRRSIIWKLGAVLTIHFHLCVQC